MNIKYRVWDKKNKRFVNTVAVLPTGQLIMLGENHWIDVNQDDYIVQSYTDKKDKKGKEIYEGDLISFSNGQEKYPVQEVKANGIEAMAITHRMTHYNWGTKLSGISTNTEPDNADYQNLKLVGNICENPELLSKND